MNLLTKAQHGYIDLITVAGFAAAPIVLGLEGGAAMLSYSLAVVHLVMTMLTAGLPLAPGRFVALALHGLIEAGVGIVLGLIGWLAFDGPEQAFFLVMAALILVVFAVTPYLDESP